MFNVFNLFTALQIVPGRGPLNHCGSLGNEVRSGDGKQIGFTHRLNINGVSNLKIDISLAKSE